MRIGGAFRECGSYYPKLTYADELWDPFFLHACQELDAEFPSAPLLQQNGWSLGLSPEMIQSCKRSQEQERAEIAVFLSAT